MKHRLASTVVLTLGLAALSACNESAGARDKGRAAENGQGTHAATGTGTGAAVAEGSAGNAPCPPPQCLPTLTFVDTMTDEQFAPDRLKGNVVVVNFWATWCKPCEKEIPAFNRVYERLKSRGVFMFGILNDSVEQVDLLNYASDHEMTYPIVRMDDTLFQQLKPPRNIPVTYIYDRSGKRVVDHLGALSETELEAHLLALLGS